MKKNLAVLLAIVLAVAPFAACAPTPPASSAPPAPSTAPASSAAAPAPSAAAPAPSAAAPAAAPEITLVLGHVVADETPIDKGNDYFAKLVGERSNGRIKVEVYPASALGDNRSMLEAVQLGNQDMISPSVAPLAGFTTSTMLFDLPFLFKSNAHAEAVLDGEIGEGVFKDLETKGFVGLAWFTQGWRQLSTKKTEVHKPSDLAGLKIRTMENEIHMATFKLLGASPVPMAYSEVFTSLQQGIIDGQENPMSNIKLSGFYEAQGFVIKTGHIYDPIPLIISQKTWEKLSPDDQKLLKECAAEAKKFERETAYTADDAFEKEINDSGKCKVIQLTEEERAAFLEACKPIYDQYAEKIGKDRIDKVLAMGQ